MGISTGCAIFVGLSGEDIYDLLPKDVQDRIDEEGDYHDVLGEDGDNVYQLDSISPWFDAEGCYHYWGIKVAGTYSGAQELAADSFDDFREKVQKARDEFKARTGIDGRLYISPNVW